MKNSNLYNEEKVVPPPKCRSWWIMNQCELMVNSCIWFGSKCNNYHLFDLGNVIWPRNQLVEFTLILSLWSHFHFYFIFVKEGKECASCFCIHLLNWDWGGFIVNTTPKPKVHHQLCSLITIWMFYCYNA